MLVALSELAVSSTCLVPQQLPHGRAASSGKGKGQGHTEQVKPEYCSGWAPAVPRKPAQRTAKKEAKAKEKRHKDVFGGSDNVDEYYEAYGNLEDDFM